MFEAYLSLLIANQKKSQRYIAVAERGDRGAQVNVFDLKSFRKRKNLVNTEGSSKVIRDFDIFIFL